MVNKLTAGRTNVGQIAAATWHKSDAVPDAIARRRCGLHGPGDNQSRTSTSQDKRRCRVRRKILWLAAIGQVRERLRIVVIVAICGGDLRFHFSSLTSTPRGSKRSRAGPAAADAHRPAGQNTGPYRFTGINKGWPRVGENAALRPVHGHLNDRAENPSPSATPSRAGVNDGTDSPAGFMAAKATSDAVASYTTVTRRTSTFPAQALIRIISAAIATALARRIISPPRQAPADYFPARPAELNQ